MIIKMIEGVTRVLGVSQGYRGLPVRDELQNTPVDGPQTPMMVSAWEPTPDELERLNRGALVYLRIVGKSHPPVRLEVGDVS